MVTSRNQVLRLYGTLRRKISQQLTVRELDIPQVICSASLVIVLADCLPDEQLNALPGSIESTWLSQYNSWCSAIINFKESSPSAQRTILDALRCMVLVKKVPIKGILAVLSKHQITLLASDCSPQLLDSLKTWDVVVKCRQESSHLLEPSNVESLLSMLRHELPLDIKTNVVKIFRQLLQCSLTPQVIQTLYSSLFPELEKLIKMKEISVNCLDLVYQCLAQLSCAVEHHFPCHVRRPYMLHLTNH